MIAAVLAQHYQALECFLDLADCKVGLEERFPESCAPVLSSLVTFAVGDKQIAAGVTHHGRCTAVSHAPALVTAHVVLPGGEGMVTTKPPVVKVMGFAATPRQTDARGSALGPERGAIAVDQIGLVLLSSALVCTQQTVSADGQ